ncbi:MULTISPECIES: hypothetical protein [unclassified Pseudovibrio]|uniref:hypothetical protein n=1 Tax=unclassified Pseudovibrio TaxID=2627060 RepID=UPI0007AE860A|nr:MULTISPECIES: hypothetical protein [unclassified Pseudovibrio]KZL00427.1 hypothetical protein PsW74_02852 [Pseudovibrio sp. W74]KZL07427.1 hypothetical protein PsAD14_03812 [Pseudovibrio sp. Ad14]
MGAVLSILIKTKTGRALVAALLLCAFAAVAYDQIRQGAFIEAEHDALQGTVKAEQQRKQDDAFLQGLEDYRLCLEYFDDSGLRNVAECEQLQRVHKE